MKGITIPYAHIFILKRLLLLSFFILTPICQIFADTLNEKTETFFNNLSYTFNSIQVSKDFDKKPSLVDNYFIDLLKKNQVLSSIVRTNEKGRIQNCVIRGQKSTSNHGNVSKELWFVYTREKLEPYYDLVTEENGRYYLLWAKPQFVVNGSKSQFTGVIVIKIDLWDSFHKIASSTDIPFVIMIGSKGLFTHLWKSGYSSSYSTLQIPGIKQIRIRWYDESRSVKGSDTLSIQDSVLIETPVFNLDSEPREKPSWKKRLEAIMGIGIIPLGAAAVGICALTGMILFRFSEFFRKLINKKKSD